MLEVAMVFLILAAGSLSYWFSYAWLARIISRRGRITLRIGLALAATLAGFDFTRPWVFPLVFGLLVGSLLSSEFC